MKTEFLNKIKNNIQFGQLELSLKSDQTLPKVIYTSSLYGASKALLVQKLFETKDQIILLMPDSRNAKEIHVELNILGLGEYLILFEEFTPEVIQEKLNEISRLKRFVLISTYNLLTLNLPEKALLEKHTTIIHSDGKIKYDELIEYLNFFNYQKEKFVEVPGEFSVRGSIIDFWSYSEHNPVRLEYDGDFLESIRYFDSESQRSIEKTESISLSGKLESSGELTSGIFDYLDKPLMFASSFEIQNLNPKPENILY